MTVDLLFSGALGPQPGGAVELLFGGSGGGPPDPPETVGRIRASVGASWRGAAAVALPPRLALPWRTAQALLGARVASGWSLNDRVGSAVRLPWVASAPIGDALRAAWGNAVGLGTSTRTQWVESVPVGDRLRAPWQRAARAQRTAESTWGTALRSRNWVLAAWSDGTPVTVRSHAPAGDGQRARGYTWAPWRTGMLLESIGGPWTPPPTTLPAPVPCYLPDPGGDVLLLLKEAATGLTALIFACRRAALAVVPIRRVYMVTNVTSLVRVSDGANIPVLGFSLSLDVDSWAWGFSASAPADALALVEPEADGTPVELAAWVNGTEFRVFTESISRERTFGQAGLRLQGRGATAVLGEPTSMATTFSAASALTSQQLVDQALPAGWTADFQLDPWLVPGGVWSHQGTPISATVAIAQAGGGYVRPHASLSQIAVLPLYPVAPWAWGGVTPDLELPAAYATREGIEWVELPRYNRVYVSGTTAGVLGRVTRAGSAGDVLAPMVTDALITTVAAARQRGLPVLARTGRVAFVTLRLPVAEGTGVIEPGKFVRYVDGAITRLGLARGVTVEVAGHQVWQTVRLETFA